MATNFPASLDTLTNPTSSDSLSSPSHSAQHANANDAIEAIETALLDGAPLHIDDANERVGVGNASPSYRLDVTGDINASGDLRIGGTAVGNYTTWTPTPQGWTVGNATVTARYAVVDKLVHCSCEITWGSTSTSTGPGLRISLPVTGNYVVNVPVGTVWWYDTSTNLQVFGPVSIENSGEVMFNAYTANTTYVGISYSGGSVPFTLQTGDVMRMTFTYEAA